jgi:uncharacterized protein
MFSKTAIDIMNRYHDEVKYMDFLGVDDESCRKELYDKCLQDVLIDTIKDGNTFLVKKLLSKLLDVNVEVNGNTPLLWACKYKYNNNTEILNLLLDKGADINVQNWCGQNPLLYACRWGDDTNTIKLLLDKDANVNVQDEDCNTPLLWACPKNKTEIIKLLLDKDANVNVENKYGETPLLWACRKNNTEIVKMLLDKDANVNVQSKVDGETPLLWACFRNNWDIAKLLLEKGSDVNVKNMEGRTAMYYARRNNIEHLLVDVDAGQTFSIGYNESVKRCIIL